MLHGYSGLADSYIDAILSVFLADDDAIIVGYFTQEPD
jgi:hypothetical protein